MADNQRPGGPMYITFGGKTIHVPMPHSVEPVVLGRNEMVSVTLLANEFWRLLDLIEKYTPLDSPPLPIHDQLTSAYIAYLKKHVMPEPG